MEPGAPGGTSYELTSNPYISTGEFTMGWTLITRTVGTPISTTPDAVTVTGYAGAPLPGVRRRRSLRRESRCCLRTRLVRASGPGLFRAEGGGGFEVFSAGTKPSSVRPEAIAVMKEIGIDISGHRSKSVDEFSGQSINYVVTVCDNARDNCPVFPAGSERIHWSFEDPAAVRGSEQERLAAFRRIRDQIHERVKAFFRDRVAAAAKFEPGP